MTSQDTSITKVEALSDSRLIVWSPRESRKLYNLGYYGKPLGIPKPKEDFEAPLVLDPIEGIFLMEKGIISVYSGEDNRSLSLNELRSISREALEGFDEKYIVYKDLRNRGYVATPGIKYGCDFAVYEEGPGLDHAPFLVKVKCSNESLTAAEIVEAGRLATTVKKTFIIAMVAEKEIKYMSFKWWKP